MGKCQIPVGGRELIPGAKGQYLSSGAGHGLGSFSFLVVACLTVEARVSLSLYKVAWSL